MPGGAIAERFLGFVSAHAAAWRAIAQAHPVLAITVFTLATAAAVVAFLPIALMMTAVGGYLFGAVVGTIASVAGATLGALVVYAFARGIFSGAIHRRYETRPGTVQRLLHEARTGVFGYVLTLRFLPLTPFGLISLGAGAGRMPVAQYLVATAVGITPECAVYAAVGQALTPILNAGGRLRPSDLTRPGALLAFTALAALSLITIVGSRLWRARSGQPRD